MRQPLLIEQFYCQQSYVASFIIVPAPTLSIIRCSFDNARYQGVRALTALDVDLNAFLPGYASLQAAFGHQRTWYDWHQAMNYASLLSLRDSNEYRDFEERLQTFKDKETAKHKEKDRKALRFGIVMQLRMLALHGPTREVCKKSMGHLVALAG